MYLTNLTDFPTGRKHPTFMEMPNTEFLQLYEVSVILKCAKSHTQWDERIKLNDYYSHE